MRDAFSALFEDTPRKNGGGTPAVSSFCLPALTGCADAFLAAAAVRPARLVLVVTAGLPDADRLVDDLTVLTAREPTRTLLLPPPVENDRALLGQRLKTLAALKAWSLNPYPCVIVVPYPALITPVPLGATRRLQLATGSIPFRKLADELAAFGYRNVPQVEGEGDYSIRGGIVDAWSPGEEFPVRAEFFGDDLESLRTFNPASQISIGLIPSADLLPVSTDTTAAETGLVTELLPPDGFVIALDHNAYTLPEAVAARTRVFVGDPAPAGVPTRPFKTAPLPGFAELGANEAHHPELFESARARLAQHLEAAKRRGIEIRTCDDLSGGFETESLIVVTKADRVFTRRKSVRRAAVAQGTRLSDFDTLEPGEYVVHIDYGVGRYVGSSHLALDGKQVEVFTIEYADGAKLHVPAAHAHLLSRYVGVKGVAVQLHRLDGKRWEKDKKAAQKSVADLAAALLETQARRETMPGYAYDVACEGCEAFEAAFPFEETPDQIAAIAAVKKDLAARRPMDRLICGDAGYGKTEVAMRAAYIAAMNGKQVAVLAPTTVLAEQHFETFTARFDGTPLRIEAVSRFQTRGTHSGTFQRLATGGCDIVIGTHAILSGKIAFHDLGLIIIDEEQRFGVRHKEFLKRLRATADVLTLSATPIPRTLYLAMTGARDLSLLRTPPRERVAVETHIIRDSDEAVFAAIEAECARGGQVYFLHNRIATISRVERRLHALCPRVRITVAHGRMDAETLARKMRDFERGRYDLLLSTTIVESGIDIPRANTILIDQADHFGMADLYQLRGRVGRSARQGHAYFLLPPSGIIDAEARERLDALSRHGGLGAGFNLAVRDLELRGAGNLLGAQQSGHIAAVGFGLYCQLLQRTIAMLKGEKVCDIVDVQINLDFTTPRLPYEYIEEDVQRLSLLKRFAEAQDVRIIDALAKEMRDRFGKPPPEALEFVQVAKLRVLCAKARIDHIDVRGTRVILYKAGTRAIHRVFDLTGRTPAQKLRELQDALRVS